jgi:hypothetical protein
MSPTLTCPSGHRIPIRKADIVSGSGLGKRQGRRGRARRTRPASRCVNSSANTARCKVPLRQGALGAGAI